MDTQFGKLEDVEACIAINTDMGFETKIDELKLAQERKQLIVVTDDKKPIAFLWFCYMFGHKPFINFIRVLPKYQSQGVGRQMFDFFENEMKKLGKDMIFSSSKESNDGSRAFHKKLGFQECGVWSLKNEWTEVFFLKKI